MNTRRAISNILQYTGANAIALAMRRDSVAVLCYHRVLDAGDPERALTDQALITSTHVFDRQMEIIAGCFHPMTLSEALRQVVEGQPKLLPRSVLITFDDGVGDTYRNAFPTMKRLGLPGVVFLATGFIGTRERHWADLVHRHVADHFDSSTAAGVVERLKRMPAARRQELLEGVTDFCMQDTAESAPNLTWDQVEEMADHGFEFGSHTRNHLILPYETDDSIRTELDGCADDIHRRLGRRPTVFAYPDGQFDDRTTRIVAESGYMAAFTCDEGFARKASYPVAMPRLLMHDGVSTAPDGRFSKAMFLTYLAGTVPRRYRRDCS